MTLEHHLRIILQAGPLTPPNSLLRDLEAINGIKLDVRRLGTSLRSGGAVTFVIVTTNNASIPPLAEILHRHTKRLDARASDDLFILLGGEINTDEEVVGFRDVRCQRPVSLKNKSLEEIKEILDKL